MEVEFDIVPPIGLKGVVSHLYLLNPFHDPHQHFTVAMAHNELRALKLTLDWGDTSKARPRQPVGLFAIQHVQDRRDQPFEGRL